MAQSSSSFFLVHLIKTPNSFFFPPFSPQLPLPLCSRSPSVVFISRVNNLRLPGVCLETSRFIIGASRAQWGGRLVRGGDGTRPPPRLPHPSPSALVCVGGKNYSSYSVLSLGAEQRRAVFVGDCWGMGAVGIQGIGTPTVPNQGLPSPLTSSPCPARVQQILLPKAAGWGRSQQCWWHLSRIWDVEEHLSLLGDVPHVPGSGLTAGWRGQLGDTDMVKGCSDWLGDVAEWKGDQTSLGAQLGWRDAQGVWEQ